MSAFPPISDQTADIAGGPLRALFGHRAVSDLSPNCAPKRTSVDHAESRVHAWPLTACVHIPGCALAPDLPVGRRSRCRSQSFCPATLTKTFLFFRNANQAYISSYPVPLRRGVAHRHDVGCGKQWTRAMSATIGIDLRTAKSCGPDAPTLASSLWG